MLSVRVSGSGNRHYLFNVVQVYVSAFLEDVIEQQQLICAVLLEVIFRLTLRPALLVEDRNEPLSRGQKNMAEQMQLTCLFCFCCDRYSRVW